MQAYSASSGPALDLSGRVLGGRYRVTRLLGSGGMGAVYEAVQEGLGRKVALKVLHAGLAWDPDQIERFRREAQAAAAIGHPNIVQVTDFSAAPGEPPFLVMELLSGRSLGQTIADEGALAPARVAYLASQMLHALAAAHAAGIVHRDIKPDNVFLTSLASHSDVVKLLDFGVAKLQEGAGKLTATGAMIGTPAYMAPEQARGTVVDARADLYAVGACMFHALSGRLPFEASSAPALLYAILEQTPPELSTMRGDVPAPLSRIIARALSKDPAARFASAGEMRAAIEPYAGASTTGAFAGSHAPTFAPSVTPAYAASARMSFDATVAASAVPASPTVGGRDRGSGGGLPTWVWIAGGLVLVGGLLVVVGAALFFSRGSARPASIAASASDVAGPASSAGAAATSAAHATATGLEKTSALPTAIPARPTSAPANVAPTAATSTNAASTNATSTNAATATNAAPSSKPTGRKTAHMSSMVAGDLFSIEQVRTAINNDVVQGQVNACYAASEFDPVDHQFTMWQLTTKPNGDVGSVGTIPGATDQRSPKLDGCMGRVLGALHLGPPAKPQVGEVRVGFEAELPWKK